MLMRRLSTVTFGNLGTTVHTIHATNGEDILNIIVLGNLDLPNIIIDMYINISTKEIATIVAAYGKIIMAERYTEV